MVAEDVMRVVLMVLESGRASVHAATDSGQGDYTRVLSPDEMIQGKRVRDYGPGVYELKALPTVPINT